MNWSYLAGFIDGEGSIGLHKNLQRPNSSQHGEYRRGFGWHFRVRIGSTNLSVLKEINQFLNHRTRIYNDHRPNRPKVKMCYIIEFNHNEQRKILPKILSHLVIKREQVKLVIEGLNLLQEHSHDYTPNDGRLEKIFSELKTLNHRGQI